jgi:hypothetical protein
MEKLAQAQNSLRDVCLFNTCIVETDAIGEATASNQLAKIAES